MLIKQNKLPRLNFTSLGCFKGRRWAIANDLVGDHNMVEVQRVLMDNGFIWSGEQEPSIHTNILYEFTYLVYRDDEILYSTSTTPYNIDSFEFVIKASEFLRKYKGYE